MIGLDNVCKALVLSHTQTPGERISKENNPATFRVFLQSKLAVPETETISAHRNIFDIHVTDRPGDVRLHLPAQLAVVVHHRKHRIGVAADPYPGNSQHDLP